MPEKLKRFERLVGRYRNGFLTCGDYPKNELESLGRAWTLPKYFMVWI